MNFSGAKLALFLGRELLVIQRDDKPDIPWPNHWDLPGGGREGNETPVECVVRETHEEVGLSIKTDQLVYSTSYERPHGNVWFFVAHLPHVFRNSVKFGSEGQGWRLLLPQDYCRDPLAVPHFAYQLHQYLAQCSKKSVSLGKTPRC